MREIKFRAWTGGVMEYFNLCDNFIENLMRSGFIIMQYTGIKDKNGKEIYEGDIVDHDYGRYKIIFDGGYFQTECIEKKGTEPFMFNGELLIESLPESFKVIGNIHENPHLLEHPDIYEDEEFYTDPHHFYATCKEGFKQFMQFMKYIEVEPTQEMFIDFMKDAAQLAEECVDDFFKGEK